MGQSTPDITSISGKSSGGMMILSTTLAALAGVVTMYFLEQRFGSSKLTNSGTHKSADTGAKTPDGKSVVEVTGSGGTDNGVRVKGYTLPTNIAEVKLPLTVVVIPNASLLSKKAGDKITFTSKLNDELMFMDDNKQQNAIWLPDLVKAALGSV
jgi:hypothetical protein